MESNLRMSGVVTANVIRTPKAPVLWRIKNAARLMYIWGFITNKMAKAFSKVTRIPTITAELEATKIYGDGRVEKYGVVSYRVVTDDGVDYMADDWVSGSPRLYNVMKYVGCGTNNTAENATDSALGTECTTALNPDSTRATGTVSQDTAGTVKIVGTLTFDGAAAVVEHGIFNQAATGGGVLWDRSVFAAINVASSDSIQFTYTLTINSGG